jgi:hypothetical protein
MSRVLIAALVVGSAACTARGSQPAASPAQGPSASQAAPAAGPPPPWWCVSFVSGVLGICQPSRLACEGGRMYLLGTQTDKSEQVTACTPQQDAVCFDTQDVDDGDTEIQCHPTFASCRSRMDYFRSSKADQVRIVSACRSASSPSRAANGSPPPDDAAHWWCLSFADDRIGSCDRTRGQCEASRDYVLRTRPSPQMQVSDCRPQPSAMCFDTRDAQGNQQMACHPTLLTCQGHIEFVKGDTAAAQRPISDCHPVD